MLRKKWEYTLEVRELYFRLKVCESLRRRRNFLCNILTEFIRDHLEDLEENGRILMKWMVGRTWNDSPGLWQRHLVSYRGYVCQPLVSVKRGISWLDREIIASVEGFCSLELGSSLCSPKHVVQDRLCLWRFEPPIRVSHARGLGSCANHVAVKKYTVSSEK